MSISARPARNSLACCDSDLVAQPKGSKIKLRNKTAGKMQEVFFMNSQTMSKSGLGRKSFARAFGVYFKPEFFRAPPEADATPIRTDARRVASASGGCEFISFDVGCSMLWDLTSNIEHRTSNIEHPTSNIEHRTSNIEHRTSNIEHRTSNIEHRTSNIQHRTPKEAPVIGVLLWNLPEKNQTIKKNSLAT